MTAFNGLANEPRWIWWRSELRGNKAAKVPYSPFSGRAKADDPRTWGTRQEAATKARHTLNGHAGGLGIELGDLGTHICLAGADLDSCIDETGCLASWAEKILVEFDTYCEISPSGKGVKAFFYCANEDVRPLLEAIGITNPNQWGARRSVGEDDRDHGPAVEIYFSHRYFAVTERPLPGKPERIALLDRPRLKRIANLIPPGRAANTNPATSARGDNSRSAIAFRKGAQLRRAGRTFEQMVDALRNDPETAAWCREKGEHAGQRELRRIWDRAALSSSEISEDEGVPVIIIEGGKRHIAADQGIDALVAAKVRFYQRNRKLQRVALVQAKNTSGEIMMVPGIISVEPAMMGRELGRSAIWQRFDMKQKKYVRFDPPGNVASQILSMVGEWPFAPLNGIVQCPTLRRDGSLLDQLGYDEATGLILVGNVPMPTIRNQPTRHDALHAMELLRALLEEFPFVDHESEAVALSMIITPVVRGSMTVAPMHLVTAPLPGTGKSYLADCASMIATGERCAVKSASPNYEETEKRLIGAALAGFPIIALDNCRDDIAGDFFCQIVERPLLELRALGKSDQHRIPNTFTMFVNGNNASVAEDMVRRTVRSGLDANLEHPETRKFRSDPLGAIQRDRGQYIAAALTIPLAYQAAGCPNELPPLISFEEWSRVVREPLVWLGCADPVQTQQKLRTDDPRKIEKTAVYEAWKLRIGVGRDRACLTKEVIDIAGSDEPLREALLAVAAQRFTTERKIDPKALGKWLSAHEGTIATKCKLTVDRADASRPRWFLHTL